MNDTVKLGKNQERVLAALKRFGRYPSTWVWGTHSATVRILDSLAKKGLVRTEEVLRTDMRGRVFPEGHVLHGTTRTNYYPAKES